MNETCPTCHFQPCCCHSLRIIRKRHEYLTRITDMNKLEEYFGITDTDYVRHSITLERTDLFDYILNIKRLNKYDPLAIYINGLPRDINNFIYSYLSVPNVIVKARIIIERGYPFVIPIWKILSFVKDGKRQDVDEETANVNCIMKNTSACMTIEKEILFYATTVLSYT